MSDKFTFKGTLPIWKLILGSLALVLGVFSLFSSFKGFILIGMSLFLLLVEGSEFNFTNGTYREIKSILGLSFGKWKPLPKIDYLSVFRTKENTVLRSRTAEANVSKDIIKLILFYNKNQKIEAYNTYLIDDAFKKADEIATILEIDILDATDRPFKWL